MLRYLDEHFGNPSSGHRYGEAARHGLEQARARVATLINAEPNRVIFTSGGTEANNMAIASGAAANPARKHLLTSAVEHASVLKPLEFLARHQGYQLEVLPVATDGGLDLEEVAAAIRPETALVSLMAANNETGVVWPLAEIAALCRSRSVFFHCDAVQMAGKEEIDVRRLGVDYLSLAGHKLHGPKGIGALYVRRGAPLVPLILGAGQENGQRAGTENVAAAVGFGKACELAVESLPHYRSRISVMRDRLEKEILAAIPEARINGNEQPRLANTINVSFKNCASGALIQELDERGIAVSAHAACHSGDLTPSHVLAAMQVPETFQHGTLRISLSRFNTMDEVEALLAVLPGIVARSRRGFAA